MRPEVERGVESHPSLEEVVAAIDGRLTPPEKALLDSHLAQCAACRAEYVEVSLLAQSAPPVAAARRRWLPAASLVAAASVLLAVILPLSRHPSRESRPTDQRAPTRESVVVIVDPPPAAAIPRDSLRFTWRAAAAATYRVIITDSTGTELYSRATSDTTLALPPSVVLQAGARYFWLVDELRADGTSLSSPASSFSILP